MKKFALDKYRDCKHEYVKKTMHFGMDYIRTKELCKYCGLSKEMEESVNNLIQVENDRKSREEQKRTESANEEHEAAIRSFPVTDVPLEEDE